MNPTSFKGGARIGQSYWAASNYTWPLATLTLSQEEVMLKTPFKQVTLRRDQITGISAYRGMISDGIQIEHASNDAPPFLIFWTSSPNAAAEFGRLDYGFREANATARPAQRYGLTVVLPLIVLSLFFCLELASCFRRGDGIGDAMLNATGLTAFGATIYFVLRKRVLR